MNERIKQLAEQASHQSPDGYPVTIPYSKDFAEKFAELIVKECASVALMSNGNNLYVCELIKQHFGVEE
jgi:roadblock/LC7 domain-containing protein